MNASNDVDRILGAWFRGRRRTGRAVGLVETIAESTATTPKAAGLAPSDRWLPLPHGFRSRCA